MDRLQIRIVFSFLTLVGLLTLYKCQPIQKNKQPNLENKLMSDSLVQIVVDGKLKDWNGTYYVSGLTNPWGNNDIDKTIFNYHISDKYFKFYFKTEDTTFTVETYVDEMSVAAGDRVELFFSPQKDIDEYYCFEISPKGGVLDYKAKHYREFDNDWDFKSLVLTAIDSYDSYIVEGRVSLDELRSLGMKDSLYLGIFRADYLAKDSMNWYTKSIPESETPDFHISTAFEEIAINK